MFYQSSNSFVEWSIAALINLYRCDSYIVLICHQTSLWIVSLLKYDYNIICYIVSWEPEGLYCSSKMFHWDPEGHYCCTKSMAIAPFWFAMEHLWTAIMPFWLSTDDMLILTIIYHMTLWRVSHIWIDHGHLKQGSSTLLMQRSGNSLF